MDKFPANGESPENFEEVKKKGLETLYSYEQEQFFLDKGGAGSVYKLPYGYCLKVIEDRSKSSNRHLFDLGNTPLVEARFQERMSQTKYTGKTRVPKYFGTIDSEMSDLRSAIIMEQLDAVNLQHAIIGSAPLPEHFSIHDYFGDLERFIQHMHDVEEIAHNDLFARNLMIDNLTADPRVIDFGRAVNLRRVESMTERNRLMDEDFKRLDEAYLNLEALQNG